MISDERERKEIRIWLRKLVRQLGASESASERGVAVMLNYYDFTLLTESSLPIIGSSTSIAKSCLQDLGLAIGNPDAVAKAQIYIEANPDVRFKLNVPPEASEWGLRFLGEILAEVRKAICAKNSEYSKLKAEYKSYPEAFAVALSTGALASLGINGPMALGVATFVLLVLATATKNAFCTMTDQEVLKAVQKAAMTKKRHQK